MNGLPTTGLLELAISKSNVHGAVEDLIRRLGFLKDNQEVNKFEMFPAKGVDGEDCFKLRIHYTREVNK